MPVKRIFAPFIFLIITVTISPVLLKSESPTAGAETSLALSSLAVPGGIGKVQERFAGNSTRTIIQIQDVHAHVVAQQNIAAILERLRTVFDIEKAALEGAWTSTSLTKSRAIPTSREKQLLAGTLLDDDRISGPVYAAIMSPEPITLIGIEDETSYEKNRALFLAHLGKSEEINEKLLVYEASLKESQRSVWGPEILAFGNSFEEFRETSNLGKFFPVLLKAAGVQGADASDLVQILLLGDIMALEKLLQKERLEQELEHLMRGYKNTPWTPEELIRGDKIPSSEIGLYPEIQKLIRLYKMRDRISLDDLTTQIETLTRRILGKLVRAPEESALWEKTERFCLARRVLLLQASPADIKNYESEKLLLEAELAGAGLSEALALSLDFYALVKKRDEIFFNRLVNDPSLAGNIAIVTGGFHTDGLSKRFRDAGISYITITPELGGTPMNEKIYYERMKETRETGSVERLTPAFTGDRRPVSPSVDGRTLSELRNAIAWVDDRFPESYSVLLQTRDVRKAEDFFVGNESPALRPAKISLLSPKENFAPRKKVAAAVAASEERLDEFIAKPRLKQLETVRGWLAQAQERRGKAMLVSSVSILAGMLSEESALKLLEEAISGGDIVALAQDVPAAETPESLSSMRGIQRFEAPDIATLVEKTPPFQRLAKKQPFAIMENGRSGGAYVVLPEKPLSLILFRIITLNPSLYQAAKNPVFLALLEDLVAEILSQELPGKAA